MHCTSPALPAHFPSRFMPSPHYPHSPKKDFKLDDVMGGLVIEIPLEE
jgi:hypothetical protein